MALHYFYFSNLQQTGNVIRMPNFKQDFITVAISKQNMKTYFKSHHVLKMTPICFCAHSVCDSGTKPTLQCRDSFVDESSFRAGLISPHGMSSPVRDTQSRAARPDMSSPSSCSTVKGEFHSDRHCVDDVVCCSFKHSVKVFTNCLFSTLKYL